MCLGQCSEIDRLKSAQLAMEQKLKYLRNWKLKYLLGYVVFSFEGGGGGGGGRLMV